MALDLENPEIKAEVEKLREAAIAEVTAEMTEKYAGLEKNHEEVIADRKAASAKAKEAQEQLEKWQAAAGGRDIDDVQDTFSKIESADYKALLGDKKFDEAYEMRAKAERKEFAKQLESKDKDILTAKNEFTTLQERLTVLELDTVGIEKFLSSNGRKSSVRDFRTRLREDSQRNEEGEYFFPDAFGNPRKDSEGNDLVIQTYIDEVLRLEAEHFFPEVKGSGATGSQGNGAPPGTKKRSDMTPQEASDYINEHGADAYKKLAA